MSYEDGDVIELVDESGSIETDNAYIRGHLPADVADDIFVDWYEDCFGEDAPVMGEWKHRYGRWSTEAGGLTLREYAEPGRGRFPITHGVRV